MVRPIKMSVKVVKKQLGVLAQGADKLLENNLVVAAGRARGNMNGTLQNSARKVEDKGVGL